MDNINPKEERIYPKVMGKNLTYIPVEVVQTERKLAGKLQIEGGYLAPLCHKAHARYQVSADLKDVYASCKIQVTQADGTKAKKEEFDTINGRKYFAFGAGVHNFLPDGVSMDILNSLPMVMPYSVIWMKMLNRFALLVGVLTHKTRAKKH